jgi:membrane-bound metal-dependent hydrolase YbcI (DUF457 family)
MTASISRTEECQHYSEPIRTLTRLYSRTRLLWWEWGKVIGGLGLVGLAVLMAAGYVPSPAVAAIVLHFAIDFTLQSEETALHKVDRGRHLLVHSLVAGGIPLAVAGLMTERPVTALLWMVIGVISHYAVDWTRRFGFRQVALAAVSDQVGHLLTILFVVLVCLF